MASSLLGSGRAPSALLRERWRLGVPMGAEILERRHQTCQNSRSNPQLHLRRSSAAICSFSRRDEGTAHWQPGSPSLSRGREDPMSQDEESKPVEVTEDDVASALEGLKKKKKKDKAPKMEAMGEDEAVEETEDVENLLGEMMAKKKKKEKKKLDLEAEGALVDAEQESEALGSWEESDRDYTYEELLDRVYGILRERNPELTGEKKRTILKPPEVAREGTKKTAFSNFMELVELMKRNHEHVMSFILAELGASGSIDGKQRLIVKGRFQPKSIENVLRKYMIEYVLCSLCKSNDTELEREQATRLMYMQCKQCGARRSVAPIKGGFSARVTSRRQERK